LMPICSNPWTRCSRGRWGRRKRWGGLSEDFLVYYIYNDWLCIQFNNFFGTTTPVYGVGLHQFSLHFTKNRWNYMKLHFTKIIMRSYTSRKLHFTSFNEDVE
jgi:hypothetical protein